MISEATEKDWEDFWKSEDLDIRAIHPDKMEDFAEYLVRKARQSE